MVVIALGISMVREKVKRMDKLKPCPFCGGAAEMCSAFDNKFLGKYWYVRCKNCYSRGTGMYESRKELAPNEEYEAIRGAWKRAVEAWNRREGEADE